jgi:hypothetical protein
MHSLSGVGRNRHHLEQMPLFLKVIEKENDFLPVIFLDSLVPLVCRSVFYWASTIFLETNEAIT